MPLDPNSLSALITASQEIIASLVQAAGQSPAIDAALAAQRQSLYAMQSALGEM